MNKTRIEYVDYSWNPVVGCKHNCPYCYAKRIAERFKGTKAFPDGFEPEFYPKRLEEPKKIKKPSKIFVCSMADLFGEWVPDEWIDQILQVVEQCPHHRFLFLTKNPKRFGEINGRWYNYQCGWPKNGWFGTTITNQSDAERVLQLPYGNANTFISIEPLQESIDLSFYLPTQYAKYHCSFCGHYATDHSELCQNCNRIGGYSGSFRKQPVNWIIVGAQTGPGAVKPKPEWVQTIIDEARGCGTPIFLKDNLHWAEKIQEFPEV